DHRDEDDPDDRQQIDRPTPSPEMPRTSRGFQGGAPDTPGEIHGNDVRKVEPDHADRRHDRVSAAAEGREDRDYNRQPDRRRGGEVLRADLLPEPRPRHAVITRERVDGAGAP